MKIGIIVYSSTGHTLSVARQLQGALSTAGHDVALEQVLTEGTPKPGALDVPLKTRPAVDGYEGLVLAAPVWGGQPAAPMTAYLQGIPSLQGKRVAYLVTGAFPPGLGRNQALARMREICQARGATLCGEASVGWLSLHRKRHIAAAVEALSRSFQMEDRV